MLHFFVFFFCAGTHGLAELRPRLHRCGDSVAVSEAEAIEHVDNVLALRKF